MTRADRWLVLAVALAVVASVPLSASALASRGSVAIVTSPAGRSEIDLSVDGLSVVEGRIGAVLLQVREGEVRVVDADCPDRTCVRMREARPGRPVICAPNGVCISSSAGRRSDLDAVSR